MPPPLRLTADAAGRAGAAGIACEASAVVPKALPILCENTFDGHVETDLGGTVRTTKADPASHGFGLAQVRAVAEKYDSLLAVSWTRERFTVQTALQFSQE